jgi:hypothetical protein
LAARAEPARDAPAPEQAPPFRFADVEALIAAAVERVAATDPNPQDPFRGLYVSDERALALARGRGGLDLDGRLLAAAGLLGFDELDACVLALCLAPELDPRFGRLFGYLHDDVTRRLASPRLVARLLTGAWGEREALDRFAFDMPLRTTGAIALLEPDAQTPLAERPVRVRERLVGYVLGTPLDGERSEHLLRVTPPPRAPIGRRATLARLRALLGSGSRLPLLVAGPDAPALLAEALGASLMLVAPSAVSDDGALDELLLNARLAGAHMCVELGERLERADAERIAAGLALRGGGALLCASSRAAASALGELELVLVEVPMPSFDERLTLWSEHGPAEVVTEIAAKFRLSATQIAYAAEVAGLSCDRGAGAAVALDRESLHRGARQASSRRLEELAIRVAASECWEDLVLPERQLETLRAISAHLRHRDLVLSRWGYERIVGQGQGLKVLFFGESGTGKTMAGRVLAHELGLDIYRIDLAAVVSKYIGETEKNLDRIFEAAAGSNAILFFDEADALFGKRSEVSDAHDRYANIEVAYLLQKMEAYPGAVILATNFRGNLDDAFLRRLDFAIEFPFPEAEQRAALWRGVLPDAAPVASDVDLERLAERFKLSGGSIRNCSLAAAFLAADEGAPIAMRHLLRGVSAEYVKLGRLTLGTDFEPSVEGY